jgi:hypothetical protein
MEMNKMKNLLKTGVVLASVLFLWVTVASAAINIDGRMDETEWNTNQSTDYGDVTDYWDVERLGLIIDQANDQVYFALQTGFSLEGGRKWVDDVEFPEYHVESGDFALDLGGDGSYDAAIRFSFAWNGLVGTKDTSVSGYYTISDVQFISGVTSWEGTSYYTGVGNYRANNGTATNFTTGTGTFTDGTFAFAVDGSSGSNLTYTARDHSNDGDYDVDYYEYTSYPANHVIEGSFDLAMLTSAGLDLTDPNAVKLKWTMECGNDYLKYTANTTGEGTTPPPDPVPEPSTALLLGIGLLGFAHVRRRNADG